MAANIEETQTDGDTGSARSSMSVIFSDLTVDNLVVALVSTRNAAAGITWPTSFTELWWDEDGSGAQSGAAYRFHQSGDSLTKTVTFTTGDECSLVCYEVSGLVTTTTPVSTFETAAGSDVQTKSTGTTSVPSFANGWQLANWSIQSSNNDSPTGRSYNPSAFSEETHISGPTPSSTGDIDIVTAHREVSSAAAAECTLSWTDDAVRASAGIVIFEVTAAAATSIVVPKFRLIRNLVARF